MSKPVTSRAKILTGAEFFREYREGGFHYVDKTGFLADFVSKEPGTVSLFTRPRRFGKTLTLSMTADFFDLSKNGAPLFRGLKISRKRKICKAWMNRHPVAFLSLKDMKSPTTFEEALAKISLRLARLCGEHKSLLDGEKASDVDRDVLRAVMRSTASRNMPADSLYALTSALHAQHGKRVVVLVDEYDQPAQCAQEQGYHDEMRRFMSDMLGAALKANAHLQFGVMTGCVRIAAESVFSGLNNCSHHGMSDDEHSDVFGFTDGEVDDLLAKAGVPLEKKKEIREWCNGYLFGAKTETYCPWDIARHVQALRRNPDAAPRPYWKHGSANAIVTSFLERNKPDIRRDMEALLKGGLLRTRLAEDLAYSVLDSSIENVWTPLYHAGYLTRASEEFKIARGMADADGEDVLVVPNREVRDLFLERIFEWFARITNKTTSGRLMAAFWKGNGDTLSKGFTRFPGKSVSFRDAYREDYCHTLLAGFWGAMSCDVDSNKEHGEGIPDFVVRDDDGDRAAVVEITRCDDPELLPELAEKALAQVEEKRYDAVLKDDFRQIVRWGIAFRGKRRLAKRSTPSRRTTSRARREA